MLDVGRRLYTETENMDGTRSVFHIACDAETSMVHVSVERIDEGGECTGKATTTLTAPECFFVAVLLDGARFVTRADKGAGGRVVCQLTAQTAANDDDARNYIVMETGNLGALVIDVAQADEGSESFSNLVRALVTHEESVQLSSILRDAGAVVSM